MIKFKTNLEWLKKDDIRKSLLEFSHFGSVVMTSL